ncbi:MAG TPA: hypothetical protein VGF17_16075 [Phytomonospora sp.]
MTEPALSQSRNDDFVWDTFNAAWYQEHNYGTLRPDDEEILQTVRDFFAAAHAEDRPAGKWHGIDVGPGANLYPSLSMLPFCESIRLHEYSENNVAWLRREIKSGYGESWDAFWKILTENPAYRSVEDPRATLTRIADVNKDSVFRLDEVKVEGGSLLDLPTEQWDIGTMFFVAESLTAEKAEFEKAVRKFVHSLRPRAPFAAAFMKDSAGYFVDGQRFPAVAITEADVRQCLASLASNVDVRVLGQDASLRDGYGGMIIATGRAGDN